MPATSYGNYSPREDQPYPIETELAKMAATSPAQAQNMLDTYQLQRQTAGNNYDLAMQGQHEFAKQQLAQQLYEANLKALPEMSKPGVARLLQGAPGYQGVFGGADAGTIAQSVGQAEAANQADVLSKVGSGASSLGAAGYGLPIPAIEGMTGVGGIIQQDPRDIAVAKINAAGRIAAAGAGGGAGPSVHLTTPPNPDAGGSQVTMSWPSKAHQTPEGAFKYGAEHGQTPQGLTNLPNAPQGGGGGANQPPAAQPPSTQRPAAAAAPGVKPVFDQVRTAIEANRSKLGDAAYNDLQAGMKQNGGNPIIKMGPDGKNHLYGASGKPYS